MCNVDDVIKMKLSPSARYSCYYPHWIPRCTFL